MSRRGKGSRFGSRFGGDDDMSMMGDINPMDGVSNLSDVMLVFACGLMVAVILNWNVDITKKVVKEDVTMDEEIELNESLSDDPNTVSNVEQNYEQFGTVYHDPSTGKYYVVYEEEE